MIGMNGYPCSRQRRVEARQTILESERIYLRLDRANESVAFMALQHVIKPCMGQRSFEFVLSSFSRLAKKLVAARVLLNKADSSF